MTESRDPAVMAPMYATSDEQNQQRHLSRRHPSKQRATHIKQHEQNMRQNSSRQHKATHQNSDFQTSPFLCHVVGCSPTTLNFDPSTHAIHRFLAAHRASPALSMPTSRSRALRDNETAQRQQCRPSQQPVASCSGGLFGGRGAVGWSGGAAAAIHLRGAGGRGGVGVAGGGGGGGGGQQWRELGGRRGGDIG